MSICIMAANQEHWERKEFIGEDWEQPGNNTGNTGNAFISASLSIPPFEPVALTLPVPQPPLRPQTSGGTNLVRLCPLRLRLVDAFLPDLRYCCALFTLQPRPNHLFPRIALIARFLLIAG